MEKIIHCQVKDKKGFKYGDNGKCYTYNKNEKSKLKAFELAKKEEKNGIQHRRFI
jgi:hypothetical protein